MDALVISTVSVNVLLVCALPTVPSVVSLYFTVAPVVALVLLQVSVIVVPSTTSPLEGVVILKVGVIGTTAQQTPKHSGVIFISNIHTHKHKDPQSKYQKNETQQSHYKKTNASK